MPIDVFIGTIARFNRSGFPNAIDTSGGRITDGTKPAVAQDKHDGTSRVSPVAEMPNVLLPVKHADLALFLCVLR